MPERALVIEVLPDVLAVCRLDPASPVPDWAGREGFCSITRAGTRADDGLSVICREANVPAGVTCERGWRAFKLRGPFDFAQVGVLRQVLDPLADAGVPVLTIGTYDTDYILVKAGQFERAVTALTRDGHTVVTSAQAPETIAVKCAWRLSDDARAHATFAGEVIEYQPAQDRWLVRLVGVLNMDDALDAATRGLIASQVGKWALIPGEARLGLTLPLKYGTLTGDIRFFYSHDPRERR